MKSNTKKYILTNIAFAAALGLILLSGSLSYVCFLLYLLIGYVLYKIWVLLAAFLIFANVKQFRNVKENRKAGVWLFFGAIGGFIAVHTVNREYKEKDLTNMYFYCTLWLFAIMPAAVVLLVQFNIRSVPNF